VTSHVTRVLCVLPRTRELPHQNRHSGIKIRLRGGVKVPQVSPTHAPINESLSRLIHQGSPRRRTPLEKPFHSVREKRFCFSRTQEEESGTQPTPPSQTSPDSAQQPLCDQFRNLRSHGRRPAFTHPLYIWTAARVLRPAALPTSGEADNLVVEISLKFGGTSAGRPTPKANARSFR